MVSLLFLISKAVGTMGHNSAHHSKEMGRACGHRMDVMAKVHQQTHGWKHLLEIERIQQKASWAMPFSTASQTSPPAAASKCYIWSS